MEANQFNSAPGTAVVHALNRDAALLEQTRRDLEHRVGALTRKLNTEQSARQRHLKQSAALSKRLNQLLESLPGAIVVLNTDGIVIHHNSEAHALLGRPLLDIAWADVVRREIRDDEDADGNLKLRDGRWLNLARRELDGEGGEVLLLSDVSESRQKTELRERRKRLSAIGEMTAEFAHQVRTPLASAMLYAAQIDVSEPAQQRIVAKISERLCDLGRMVDDMLQYAGGPKSTSDQVNVLTLIAGSIQAVEGQIRPESSLTFHVADRDMCILGNHDALRGALVNLIKNSDQASHHAVRILVSAAVSDGKLRLSVSDDADGIPDDYADRIFEPFFTTRPQGTGLGLSVVKAVAAAHGGDAEFVSSNLGTTVSINLPVFEGANDD